MRSSGLCSAWTDWISNSCSFCVLDIQRTFSSFWALCTAGNDSCAFQQFEFIHLQIFISFLAPSFFKFINFEFSIGLNIFWEFYICGFFEIWKSVFSFFLCLFGEVWGPWSRCFWCIFGRRFSIAWQTCFSHFDQEFGKSAGFEICVLCSALLLILLFYFPCMTSGHWNTATTERIFLSFIGKTRRISEYWSLWYSIHVYSASKSL